MDKERIHKLAEELLKKLATDGTVMAGGYAAYLLVTNREHTLAREEAFYSGAEYIFTSIMNILDEGLEPTREDFDKMDKIWKELQKWQMVMRIRYVQKGEAR